MSFPLRLFDEIRGRGRPLGSGFHPVHPEGESSAARIKLNPKTRIAASLIGAGMKVKDAAGMVGVRKEYLSLLKCKNSEFRGAITQTTDSIIEATIDPAEMIRKLCGPAVQKLQYLMENADREETVLKAAESVLDRGGFGKEQKISSSNLHISGGDLQALTNAMVESARIRADFASHAGGFIAEEASMDKRLGPGPGTPKAASHSDTDRAAESNEVHAVARTGVGSTGAEAPHAVPPREAGPPNAVVEYEF